MQQITPDHDDRRLRDRKAFYARFGAEFGRAEHDFTSWLISRGVLLPRSGSAWWRAINDALLDDQQRAHRVHDGAREEHPTLAAWLVFMREPTTLRWYRAHNESVVRAYLANAELARAENEAEQALMNVVLTRLLYAHALAAGARLDPIGRVLAEPGSRSIGAVLAMPIFYPKSYPLKDSDRSALARFLDETFARRAAPELYRWASSALQIPELVSLVASGQPRYPRVSGPHAKKKIAILGGGFGALATAYELTSYPGWRERYDVTVYQLGFRLGGKAATGRGAHGRIEERGIHILQGWYNNTFRMIRESYDYVREHALLPNSPFKTWRDAIVPDKSTLFTQRDPKSGAWTSWPVIFPFNRMVPGEGGAVPAHMVVWAAIGFALTLVFDSPYLEQNSKLRASIAKWIDRAFFTPDFEESTEERPGVELGRAFEALALRAATALITGAAASLRALDSSAEGLERTRVLVEFAAANLRGLVADVYDPKTKQFDFRAINGLDYRAWLLRNGLPAEHSDSAPLRFIYCGAFHNQNLLAADIGLRSLIASISYRGSLVWKLKAGTGATITAPLYKMLAHRGVRFEFFHRVEQLHPEGSEIERVSIGVQADTKSGAYDPLTEWNGIADWHARPDAAQLDEEHARALEGVDLESRWSRHAPVRERVLERGRDFDELVLGIPVRELETICSEIAARDERFRGMLERVRTVPTIGVQLWMRPTIEGLGMDLPKWGLDRAAEPNSVIYEDLLYSWTDMNAVLDHECWSSGSRPGQLSYFCGTWPVEKLPPYSEHDFPAAERERVVSMTRDWLKQHMTWLWPAARASDGFDFELLFDPTNSEDKLRSQFFVANVDPSNQYTLAWPGSDRYRLRPDDSGYRNLFLCGDWTDFGLNVGHIEGAVTSGLKAAHGVLRKLGQTELRTIHSSIGIPEGT